MPRICQMVFHQGNCLNNKKSFVKKCRLCIEACPHKAIDEQRIIKAELCSECGLCMAVCPSDGYVDHLIGQFRAYIFSAQEIILNCPSAFSPGFEIPCLGMFDRDLWSALLVMSLERSLIIFTGDCIECSDRIACTYSVKTLKELLNVWPEKPNISVKVRPDQGEKHDPVTLTGRENNVLERKGGLREKSRQIFLNWFPSIEGSEVNNIPYSRQWLIKVLSNKTEMKIPFKALTVNTECTVCGLCEAICPQGALTQLEDSGQKRLILEPYKCVQCNRCIEICRLKALNFSIKRLTHHTITHKILLIEKAPRYCHKCGKIVLDNSQPPTCIPCALGKADQRDSFIE